MVSTTIYTFKGDYALFLNVFDTKMYTVHINVKRIVFSDTSFKLIASFSLADKGEYILSKSFEITHEVNEDCVKISEYNTEIIAIRNILVHEINDTLKHLVQSKYKTHIRVDIKYTKLYKDLYELFDNLLILNNAPSASCEL